MILIIYSLSPLNSCWYYVYVTPMGHYCHLVTGKVVIIVVKEYGWW